MSVIASRTSTIVYTGDIVGTQIAQAQQNSNSPGQTQLIALVLGANTITVPTAGSIPTAVTIEPQAGNAIALTLKGVSGDTGIAIHNTDPTIIALAPTVVSFVINAASALNIRLLWS